MKRLTEIGIRTGTDKAIYHMFTEFYDDIFRQYESPRILEIGVFNFASISMYLEYFKMPYIVGMDIYDKTQYLSEKWKFIQGDQTRIEDLERCVKNETSFDLILDDGGHTMKQQQISFGYLIDYVTPGGYYILEDLHTSFRKEYIESDCKFTSYEMLNLIKHKTLPFSNYIDLDIQKRILEKIESINIFTKNENLLDSVTSIIKIRND